MRQRPWVLARRSATATPVRITVQRKKFVVTEERKEPEDIPVPGSIVLFTAVVPQEHIPTPLTAEPVSLLTLGPGINR